MIIISGNVNHSDSEQRARDQAECNPRLIGYSDRINDPRISKSLKKINSSGFVFTLIMALVAVVGFTAAGAAEVGGFELPSAIYIGFGIGGLLIIIALFQKARTKNDKSWDGIVTDKTIRHPSYSQRRRGDYQTQYNLHISTDNGKNKTLPCTEDYYHHMQIGAHVRHHAGTAKHMLEKYDKSHDTVIYCVVCSSKNDINNDICYRCKCPLLK